ncbi:MAG: DUF4367 domain-containing protein [Aggregatilineales bacterium]
MSLKNEIIRFNHRIDALIQGESPLPINDNDKELLEIAKQLAQTDLSAESKRLVSIRQDILSGSTTPIHNRHLSKNNRFRLVYASVASIVLFMLIVLTVPPLRHLAQDIIGRFGNLIITDAPTQYELARNGTPTSTPRPRPTGTPPGESFISLTYNEIDALLDFPIYIPQYIPDGFNFCCYGGNFFGETPNHALAFYSRQAGYHDDMLNIRQQLPDESSDLIEFAVGDAVIEEVAVNGNAGLWVGEALVGQRWTPSGEQSYVTYNFLYWEQDGYVFSIQSDVLSQEEILRIAESMVPAQN